MMKFNLKKILAGMLVMITFLPASFAFADNGKSSIPKDKQAKNEKRGLKKDSNFCANIGVIQTRIADQIKKTEDKQSTNQTNRASSIAEKEGDADAKRALGRGDVDAKRLKNWGKMEGRAKTTIEKTAVATYKTAIGQAVDIRRTSVDAAVKAYRDGLATAMTTHNTSITTAMYIFKSSVDTATAKTQADCTAGISSKIAKDTFYKSVESARKVLQEARKISEMSSGLATLKNTRNNSIKLAETTFKTATEKARADLLLALK